MPRAIIVAARPRPEPPVPVEALFPDESTPGTPVPWERTYSLAAPFNRFFRDSIAALAPALARATGLPAASAPVFAREALVPLGHFYLERLFRLDRLLSARPGAEWAVAKAAPSSFPARMEVLRARANTSAAFNHLLLARQARLWGLESADYEFPPDPPAGVAKAVNRLFDPSTPMEKVRRVLLTARRRLSRRKGPIPVLSMGYSTGALKNAGFYGSYLTNIQGRLQPVDGRPDPAARDTLRRLLAAVEGPFGAFLREAGFSSVAPAAVFADFAAFAVEAWPSSLLEGARESLERALRVLEPFGSRPLIIGERGDLESLVLIAAARSTGREVILMQHGGHLGYMADLSTTLEMEYLLCDAFITWGWTRFSDYPPHPPGLRAVALPNPFLSERARRWRRDLKHGGEKRYDFLLMSNVVHQFPRAPACAAQSNIDFIEPFCAMLVDLAREARRRKVTLLHKLRDPAAAAIFAETVRAMEREGGEAYSRLGHQDKGMTREVLDQCRVVLWDQPGMGFQECLAAGIPTMCYWPRIYNREDPPAAAAIAALEAAGVIHTTFDSLFAEAERVKRIGGEAWLKEPARAKACAEFARAYCWAADEWAGPWAEFFDALPG